MSVIQYRVAPPLNEDDVARFWLCVDKATSEKKCWLWTGSKNSKGYGRFFLGGRHHYAHRLSWSLAGRETPRHLMVCHACDNPLCVNPEHLILADIATNNQDAKLKRNLEGRRKRIEKPRPDFPLTPHRGTGRWCKKIKGKLYYFGPLEDPEGALTRYLDQKDDLYAGRKPRKPDDNRLTVAVMVDKFLNSKRRLQESGELTARTWHDYYAVGKSLVEAFGADRVVDDLRPDDFEALRTSWAAKWGPVRVSNTINKVRVFFNYAWKSGLIEKPMRYGEGFRRPSKKTLRLARAEKGPRMFEAAELRTIAKAAGQPMKSMILLGINAGLGNADLGQMPMKALDLETGWIDYPRPKTGIARRVPLWPETVKAIRAWLKERPEPRDLAHAELVFVTKYGDAWQKDTSDNPVSKEMRKLLDELGINGPRNFYALRHTFETIGGESKDQIAVNAIMGHADDSMAATYRERISDDRLKAVTDHVHDWLFGKMKPKK